MTGINENTGTAVHEKITLNLGNYTSLASNATSVPNAVLEHETLSVGAKTVYAMLLNYAFHHDRKAPGRGELAEKLGVTEPSISKYLSELRANKLVETKKAGFGKSFVYTLNVI